MSDDRIHITDTDSEASDVALPPFAFGNDKVVSLVKREADRETVLILEKLLQMAKDGELIGIGVVGLTSDGNVEEQYTSGLADQAFTAVGALRFLEQRLLDEIEQ